MMSTRDRPNRDNWTIVFALFAAGNLLNAIWMLADPAHWYFNLPARVPGTGPLNEHFVRDIGCIFLLVGGALGFAAARPAWRLPAVLLATGWHVTHALVHLFDTLRGLLPLDYLLTDFPAVYSTAALMIWITRAVWRAEKAKD